MTRTHTAKIAIAGLAVLATSAAVFPATSADTAASTASTASVAADTMNQVMADRDVRTGNTAPALDVPSRDVLTGNTEVPPPDTQSDPETRVTVTGGPEVAVQTPAPTVQAPTAPEVVSPEVVSPEVVSPEVRTPDVAAPNLEVEVPKLASACNTSATDLSVNIAATCAQDTAADLQVTVGTVRQDAQDAVGEVADDAKATVGTTVREADQVADDSVATARTTVASTRDRADDEVAGVRVAADCVTDTPLGDLSINVAVSCTR